MSTPAPVRTRAELAAIIPQLYPAIQVLARQVLDSTEVLFGEIDRAPFTLAVAGRFSSGKSRLLNALVGHDLLPVDTDALTAHKAYIRYGDSVAYYRLERDAQGRSRSRPVGPADLITVRDLKRTHAKGDAPHVAAFRVAAPSPFLRTVRLVDTPGYDDPASHTWPKWARTALLSVCERADACLLVLNNNVDEADVEVIGEVAERCARVLIVLNKSDLRSREANREMAEDSADSAESVLGYRPRVFCVSAMWASANKADRAAMAATAPLRYFGAPPLHEWTALLHRIGQEAAGAVTGRLVRRLGQVRTALERVEALGREYDLTKQASHALPSRLDDIRENSDDPLGLFVHVERAVALGEPTPWRLLERLEVGPAELAPSFDLAEGLAKELRAAYSRLVATALATDLHDVPGYVLARLAAEVRALYGDAGSPQPFRDALVCAEEWADWRDATEQSGLRYDRSLEALTARWRRTVHAMAPDTAWIMSGLSQWLANVS